MRGAIGEGLYQRGGVSETGGLGPAHTTGHFPVFAVFAPFLWRENQVILPFG
jgi:hypothetical protein